MSLLAAYRRQLAEESAGRSHRFSDILRYFRAFWLGSVVVGVVFAGWFVVQAFTADDPAAGWGIVVGPVLGVLIMLAGRIPYGLAQLFLSVKANCRG